jgi:hypothetical protein
VDGGGNESWNITTCRDIPSDMLIDLTSDNKRVCTTESSFGKSYQRPSNDLVNVRNIPSAAAANIRMHGDISSAYPRDRSDNVMTNSTVHFPMGVSNEKAFILPPVCCTTPAANCNHTRCKTKSIVFHRKKNYGANVFAMAASGRARLCPPPGFSENLCLSHATCVHRRGGDVFIPLPVGEVGFPSNADASAANCSTCPNVPVPGDVMTGICNCNCNFDMNMFFFKCGKF